jgi:hypothetical protein
MNERICFGLEVVSVIALAVFVLTALFLGAVDALAQVEGNGGHGWTADSEYNCRYDVNTLCTVGGKIRRVERFAPSHGMSRGVHLVMQTAEGDLTVDLGPAWFVDNQDERFRAGDSVEILGSRITYRGESVLVAAKVRTGRRVLNLRDADGRPLWSGWKQVEEELAVPACQSVHAGVEIQHESPESCFLYKSDVDRHLWSWEDCRRTNSRGHKQARGKLSSEVGTVWQQETRCT